MLLKLICTILVLNSYSFYPASAEISAENEIREIKTTLNELELQLNGYISKFNQSKRATYDQNCVNININTTTSGIYEILIPRYSEHPFSVYCDAETHGGGWLIILHRFEGGENFHRSWNVYKKGFGTLDSEFFLGLDKIHALTAETSMELLVILEDHEGDIRYESYEKFGISDEYEQYALNTLGKANGTAGDSLRKHFTMKWSTFDRHNELNKNNSCGNFFKAGWWYHDCHESLLTGQYGNNNHGWGINWLSFRGYKYSLKRAVMMIRPSTRSRSIQYF